MTNYPNPNKPTKNPSDGVFATYDIGYQPQAFAYLDDPYQCVTRRGSVSAQRVA